MQPNVCLRALLHLPALPDGGLAMTKKNEEREYWQDVKDMADSIMEYAKDEGYPDREAILEHIHESIDGCGRVIYTWKAKMCVIYSENDGAYFDNFGSEGAVSDGGIEWSKLAYCAFEADVMEELSDREFDVNADRPGYVEPETEA